MINGDIFNCSEDIIVHQTNCQGVMGRGIALQVKQKFPEVYEEYHNYCKNNDGNEILGTSLICKATSGKYIANLFGQLYFGEGLQTDYNKFQTALTEVRDFAKKNKLSVALPYKIGCGLAHGSWDIVYTIIVEVLQDEVPYEIYKFEKTSDKYED